MCEQKRACHEVVGKNAEHFDVAFENGVFESRVRVANIAWNKMVCYKVIGINAKHFDAVFRLSPGNKVSKYMMG